MRAVEIPGQIRFGLPHISIPVHLVFFFAVVPTLLLLLPFVEFGMVEVCPGRFLILLFLLLRRRRRGVGSVVGVVGGGDGRRGSSNVGSGSKGVFMHAVKEALYDAEGDEASDIHLAHRVRVLRAPALDAEALS